MVRRLDGERGVEEMLAGEKGSRLGVRRALRFWVMESSIVERERRRKSAGEC
jgi:hypothetical protein